MAKTAVKAVMAAVALAAAAFGVHRMTDPELPEAPQADGGQNLFPFVRSLEGTRPDGKIDASASREQVASEELVRLFDYYLSAVGERKIDEIRAEIERELAQRLKPEAAEEARRLLSRYIDYKRALVEVEKNVQIQGNSPQAIRARFADMQLTRRRFFTDAEIQSMFGMQDAYDMDAIARLEIAQDRSLSEQQKRERLAALDAALPPALREAKEEPYRIGRLEDTVQKMRAQGASDDEIYRMRAAALSPEAAARMATVDDEERSWRARIDAYLAERTRMLAMSGNLADADRQSALDQLRQSRFTPDEQKRLGAYEPPGTR